MTRAAGFFEEFVNRNAYQETANDRRLIDSVTATARGVVPGCQVRWAGSQRKGTAIATSDLDLCVETARPITESERRDLRAALEAKLLRPARVLSHAIRLPPHQNAPKVDVAFANAAFGSRPLPDTTTFHNRKGRQGAARALKLWTRAGGLPYLPGWVIEALVVHLDANAGAHTPFELFVRVIEWLDERATPAAIEGVLRPAAHPRWNPAWSPTLPGRLEALRNQARALRRRLKDAAQWRNADDVGRCLRG